MKTTCQQCGKEFDGQRSYVLSGRVKYCSRNCYAEARKKRVVLTCSECGKAFEVVMSQQNGRKFCSRDCKGKAKSRWFKKEAVPWYNGGPITLICQRCGKSYKSPRSQAANSNYCSLSCRIGGSITLLCEECNQPFEVPYPSKSRKYCCHACYGKARRRLYAGINCPAWRGGVTDEINLIRGSPEYIEWREAVYKRDYWTCQDCGEKPGKITAHHIFSFRDYPDLRFEVWNGITLCRSCHAKEHKEERRVAQYGK